MKRSRQFSLVIAASALTGVLALSVAGAGIQSGAEVAPEERDTLKIIRAGSTSWAKAPAENFTGTVYADRVVAEEAPSRLSISSVSFEPGARTAWHTHPLGQTLIVTNGVGLVQVEGGPVETIGPGDVARIPPNARHWHGATATTGMTHLAIQESLNGSRVTWMELVAGATPAAPVAVQAGATMPATALVGPHGQSDNVTGERVSFRNRTNINVVGNLYVPKDIDRGRKHAAIVVGHPFGGVKEQTSGLHAMKLAELGYVTLAFDASHYGESGGEPRNIEVPSTRVEDFSAAVDFLSNYPLVDADRIGVLGVCGSGGYAVSAAQIDHRIKALATVSMYEMGRARREGLGGTVSYEQRMKTLDEIGQQRTREFAGEPRRDIRALPEKVDANTPAFAREYLDYYDTPRGNHPNSTAWYSFTSLAPMMNFFAFTQIETISPRPVLFIVGEKAMSAYFSEEAFQRAAEPKELFAVPGATHVDLYDRPEFMSQSLEKLDSFFKQYLK